MPLHAGKFVVLDIENLQMAAKTDDLVKIKLALIAVQIPNEVIIDLSNW